MVTKCNIVGSQMKNAQSVFICCSSANYTQSHRLVQTKFLRKWHCTKNRPHLPFYGFWPTVFTLDVSDLLIENSAGKSVSMFIVDNLGFINPSLCALTHTHARTHPYIHVWRAKMTIILFDKIISIAHLDSHNNKPHRPPRADNVVIYRVDYMLEWFNLKEQEPK